MAGGDDDSDSAPRTDKGPGKSGPAKPSARPRKGGPGAGGGAGGRR